MKEYYEYYLTLHRDIRNIRLHVLGQMATISYIIWCITSGNWVFLIFSPFVVYPFAWSGHYFYEKNKPAAFSSPIKAKISDWIMLKDYLMNKLPNNKKEI